MTPRVFDRIYTELKREVTSGRYKPGQRLQARSLADVLRASTSPVTNTMRQLVGEDILEYTDDDGFIIPWVTDRRLRDLYRWTLRVTTPRHEIGEASNVPTSFDAVMIEDDLVGSTERLFLAMTAGEQNSEVTRALSNNSDRLRATRALEGQLFADRREELQALADLFASGNHTALITSLANYHRRRLDAVPQLVGLSYPDRR